MKTRKRRKRPPGAFAFRSDWCDGVWICVWFTLAVFVSYSLPVGVLAWAVNTSTFGLLKTVVSLLSGVFLITVTPVLLSRVFRELDYPWEDRRRKKARAARSEGRS